MNVFLSTAEKRQVRKLIRKEEKFLEQKEKRLAETQRLQSFAKDVLDRAYADRDFFVSRILTYDLHSLKPIMDEFNRTIEGLEEKLNTIRETVVDAQLLLGALAASISEYKSKARRLGIIGYFAFLFSQKLIFFGGGKWVPI